MNRLEARENVMQMLFSMDIQMDFSNEAKETFIQNYIDDDNQIEYINEVYEAYAAHSNEIDDLIEKYSTGWKIERLAKVDLAVIRLCLSEIIYKTGEKIPVSASISEAVKIAKKYGGESSGKFVNGILGKISRENGI
ncbi:MAG: transcription antitermination factor NusB [Bacillota bacterium]|nr:transcription antitermination factor NusB [Bacillota bacterium]